MKNLFEKLADTNPNNDASTQNVKDNIHLTKNYMNRKFSPKVQKRFFQLWKKNKKRRQNTERNEQVGERTKEWNKTMKKGRN